MYLHITHTLISHVIHTYSNTLELVTEIWAPQNKLVPFSWSYYVDIMLFVLYTLRQRKNLKSLAEHEHSKEE